MKRIEKLTQEQIDRIPEWIDKWTKVGLETKPVDRKAAEAAISECYRYSGLGKAPKIVWVESPFVGHLAAWAATRNLESWFDESAVTTGIMSIVGAADHHFGSPIRPDHPSRHSTERSVNSSVKSSIRSSVKSAIYEAIGSAGRFAISSATNFEVKSATRAWEAHSSLDSCIHSWVYDKVSSAVARALGLAARKVAHGSVHGEVNSAVDSVIYDMIDSVIWAAASSAGGYWHGHFAGSFWAALPAYISYFRDVCGLDLPGDLWDRFGAYERTVRECGFWWPSKDFIIAADRPAAIKLSNKSLHSEAGPAIQYRDGWGVYALNGIVVPREIVTTPSERLDPSLILKEENVEVRREILRKIGIERCLSALKAKTLDTWEDYSLVSINIGLGESRLLKMRNPSIGVWHLEGVPTTCKTVAEALHARKPEWMRSIPIDEEGGLDYYQQGDVLIVPNNANALKRYPKILT